MQTQRKHCNATQRNATQRSAAQRNATQRNATQRKYNAAQWTLVLSLLTFWPPAPPERENCGYITSHHITYITAHYAAVLLDGTAQPVSSSCDVVRNGRKPTSQRARHQNTRAQHRAVAHHRAVAVWSGPPKCAARCFVTTTMTVRGHPKARTKRREATMSSSSTSSTSTSTSTAWGAPESA